MGPTASLYALSLPAIKPQLADYPACIIITTPNILHCSRLQGKKAKFLHWDLWVTWNKMYKINYCCLKISDGRVTEHTNKQFLKYKCRPA